MKYCKYENCKVLLTESNTYKSKTYCCKSCYKLEKRNKYKDNKHAHVCVECKSNNSYQWLKGPTCSKCYQRSKKGKFEVRPHLICEDCGKCESRGKYTFKAKYCNRCRNKRYRHKNPQIYRDASKNRRLKKPEVYKQHEINFRKNNPEYLRAKSKVRNKRVKQATPKFVDKSELYRIYKECPEGMQVDHIIPLKGDNVCGLHVPNNLQYLSPEENNKKSNKVITTHLNFEAVNQKPTIKA